MTTALKAPRTAYLLTELVASGDEAGADELWKSLDKIEAGDVMASLGAQARQAGRSVFTAGMQYVDLKIAVSAQLREHLCIQAVRALEQLVDADAGPWELPECSHCRRLIAQSLVDIMLKCARARGISAGDYARMCREKAEQAPPE